jgi:hypothetical protein
MMPLGPVAGDTTAGHGADCAARDFKSVMRSSGGSSQASNTSSTARRPLAAQEAGILIGGQHIPVMSHMHLPYFTFSTIDWASQGVLFAYQTAS